MLQDVVNRHIDDAIRQLSDDAIRCRGDVDRAVAAWEGARTELTGPTDNRSLAAALDAVVGAVAGVVPPPQWATSQLRKYVVASALHDAVCGGPRAKSASNAEQIAELLAVAALTRIARCDFDVAEDAAEWIACASNVDGGDVGDVPCLASTAVCATWPCGHDWPATVVAPFVSALASEFGSAAARKQAETARCWKRWRRRMGHVTPPRPSSSHSVSFASAQLSPKSLAAQADFTARLLAVAATTKSPRVGDVSDISTPADDNGGGQQPSPPHGSGREVTSPQRSSPGHSVLRSPATSSLRREDQTAASLPSVATTEVNSSAASDVLDGSSARPLQLSSVFTHWLHRARRQQFLAATAADSMALDHRRRATLRMWRDATKARLFRRRAVAARLMCQWLTVAGRDTRLRALRDHHRTAAEKRVSVVCFGRWRRSYEVRQAANLRRSAVARSCVDRWRRVLARRQHNKAMRRVAIDAHRADLFAAAFDTWRRRLWESVPRRRADDDAIRHWRQRRVIVKWSARCVQRRRLRHNTTSVAAPHLRLQRISRCFKVWATRKFLRVALRDVVPAAVRQRVLPGCFEQWQGRARIAAAARLHDEQVGAAARVDVVRRAALQHWRRRTAARVAVRCDRARRLAPLLRVWFAKAVAAKARRVAWHRRHCLS
jgi:hypothetical protein